jgi:acetyltransferase
MPDGQQITLRPIRPDDEPMVVQFHNTISEQSVHFRYFGALSLSRRTAHERLIRMCFIDYDRELALVAVRRQPENSRSEIIAVGRLVKLHGTQDAEIAVLVSDPFQGKGLGTELVRQLLQIAPREGVRRIIAEMLAENQLMQQVCRTLGFRLQQESEDHIVKAELLVAS